jgi:hypothetical protein
MVDASFRQESSLLLAPGVYEQMLAIYSPISGRFLDITRNIDNFDCFEGLMATVGWSDCCLSGFHVISLADGYIIGTTTGLTNLTQDTRTEATSLILASASTSSP